MTDKPKYDYRKTDLETGETQRWTGTPRQRLEPTAKEPFVMLPQAICTDIATSYDLQGFDLRLFIFLLGRLDNENWIELHQGRIASQMSTDKHEVHRPSVTKAIKHLVEAGIVLKGEYKTYRFNPNAVWKGDLVAQRKAQQDHKRGHLSVVHP